MRLGGLVVGVEGGVEGFRGIGGVSDCEAGEEPVVRAVFVEVEEGHRGGGEAVEEEGFEDSFEEVEDYEGAGEGLEGCWLGGGVVVVEEGVDEEGAGVFDQVD